MLRTLATRRPMRPEIAGICWMGVTGLLFVAVTTVVKYLGDDVPAAQSAFLRYVLGLPFLIPVIGHLRRAHLKQNQLVLFALRGGLHTVAVTLWFYAMTKISMAEVTALNYLSPIGVTVGAALFLGDRLVSRRIWAVIAGLIGMVLILRPGVEEISAGHLAMLGTALGFSGGYLIAKKLSSEVSAVVIVAMLTITVTVGLAPLAAAVWVPVGPKELLLLFLVACFATAGHYTMTRAFAAAPVSVTQPVTFLQLIWASAIGAIFFMEPVDFWVVVGGAIILAAVCALAWREAWLKTHAPDGTFIARSERSGLAGGE